MKKTDVLIIGGSAAGMVAAVTGKAHWPDKEFILVKKQKDMMVPCGIPYIFGTLENIDKNLMPVDAALQKSGIESLVDEAMDIDTSKQGSFVCQWRKNKLSEAGYRYRFNTHETQMVAWR